MQKPNQPAQPSDQPMQRHSPDETTAMQPAPSRRGTGELAEEGRRTKSERIIPRIRHAHQSCTWYRSGCAKKLRIIVNDKYFILFMLVGLFIALYLPDIWVLCGVDSNVEPDTILLIVMILFATEVSILSAVDANYFLSFFFVMDIIGTVSMIFDISWMAGTDATVPYLQNDEGDAKRNLMLLRATRAAKVGARAGRLTRVLRILRFLPFMPGAKTQDDDKQGIASVISGQLANLLATRVALLTIILVMVIPLFDMWTFPTHDNSLKAWCERLSWNLDKGRVDETVAELQMMVDFYHRFPFYGPFRACLGTPTSDDDVFKCKECTAEDYACKSLQERWFPIKKDPPRTASQHIVHTDNFMIAFNMHHPVRLEAGMSMCTITFIVFIMVFSGLALSSVVNELAVRPLERMLVAVRKIAVTVFKYSAEATPEEENEEADIDNSSEMKLLEKVVQKLAVIADLQTRNAVEVTEDMRDEDVGILSMMQGRDVGQDHAKQIQDRRSVSGPKTGRKMDASMKPEKFGITQELYDSLDLHALGMTRENQKMLAVFALSTAPSTDMFLTTDADQALLIRFITAVEKEYLANPFHNFAHAVDVLHGSCRMMRLMSTEHFLTDLEQFSLLVAALGHDLGHPGVNNPFLSETAHELALKYNDKSVLENFHCAKLYSVIAVADTNIFGTLKKDQYKEARKLCIETILHTDMMGHGAMVKDLQLIYEMNSEVFTAESAQRALNKDPEALDAGPDPAEFEVFTTAETKLLIMECILHTADVSNPCRKWEVTYDWAMVCIDEFFNQGDQEKQLGVTVQFLNDRDKLNRPNSQIGFIEFMIAPLFASVIRLWPTLCEFGDHLGINISKWEEQWAKELSPSEEERTKVAGRVSRVRKLLDDAKERTPLAS